MQTRQTNKLINYYLFSIVLAVASFGLPATESTPVRVVKSTVEPIYEILQLTGTVTSEQTASLSTHVSGIVNRINFDAGDWVEQGDTLIELDSVLASLALERSRASLHEARARLKEAERLSNEAQDLRKNKNIPETTAAARIADVNANKAIVSRLEVEVRQQQEIVKRHTLRAPFRGVIFRKLTEVGEWVNTGTAVFELVAADNLRLDVQAPQEYFALLDMNTPVEFKLDAISDKTFTGKIKTMVPVNSGNARTFLVRIVFDNNDNQIIPGMSVQAYINVNLKQEALVVPRDAIIKYPDGRNSVWVINKKGDRLIASERNVEIGRSLAKQVVIKNGISLGNIVVIEGNETLIEGQAVHILEPVTAQTE